MWGGVRRWAPALRLSDALELFEAGAVHFALCFRQLLLR